MAGQEVGDGVENGALAPARVPVGDARVRHLEQCYVLCEFPFPKVPFRNSSEVNELIHFGELSFIIQEF